MSAPRKIRLGETIRAELVDIIRREMRDPRLTAGLLSITDVEVSPDLKYATVYFSLLGDQKLRDDALKALQGAAGLLRAELGRTKSFKSVPALRFSYDTGIERGMHITDVMSNVARLDEARRVEHSHDEVAISDSAKE
jgi:ribosome-binding factor A